MRTCEVPSFDGRPQCGDVGGTANPSESYMRCESPRFRGETQLRELGFQGVVTTEQPRPLGPDAGPDDAGLAAGRKTTQSGELECGGGSDIVIVGTISAIRFIRVTRCRIGGTLHGRADFGHPSVLHVAQKLEREVEIPTGYPAHRAIKLGQCTLNISKGRAGRFIQFESDEASQGAFLSGRSKL